MANVNERKRRRIRKEKLYERQGGLCWWCRRRMVFTFENQVPGPTNPRRMTLDHLDDRVDAGRGKRGRERTVLACYECNQRRGRNTNVIAVVTGHATMVWHPGSGYGKYFVGGPK